MRRSPLLPIFLVVLVDILGFTIVYPVLPFYAERFDASPLIATSLVSVYALCSLISTPIIGRLSDQYGRRKLLLLSQAGTCAGFLVLGFSEALWMVFLGRILDGLTAGNLSTAQAYISDHTEPQNRAKAFGIIGIAFGIGFSLGPALGGVLGGKGHEHVPFLFAACLSAGSMILSYALLEPGVPAGAPASPATPASLSAPSATAAANAAPAAPGGKRPGLFDIAVYAEYFRRPGLGLIFLQFFLYTFMFSAFMSGFALFAERRFKTANGQWWTSTEVGYLFAYVGFLGIIVQGGLLGRLVKRFGEIKLAIAGFLTVVVAYALFGASDTVTLLVVAATISAFGNSVLRPVITSTLTQRVGRHEQGVALGISASLNSLSMTLAPPLGGVFLTEGWLFAWTMVPTGAAVLGLIVAIRGRSARLASGPSQPVGKPAANVSS